MSIMNPNLQIAIEAAIDAGEKIREIYQSVFKVVYKEDESPLTDADLASNEVILSYLSETQIPVISEETAQVDYAVRSQWNKCWVVDPLDGTKEFVKRNGEFTVNIALVEKGKPILGVIYVPVFKTLYFGSSQGSFKIENIAEFSQEHLAQKQKIQVRARSKDIKILKSRSHLNKQTEDFVKEQEALYNKVEMDNVGSSLKFCQVAEGKADIYPRYAPTMEWDTAAGHAIAQFAGAKVYTPKKETLIYNKPDLTNPYFIVEN